MPSRAAAPGEGTRVKPTSVSPPSMLPRLTPAPVMRSMPQSVDSESEMFWVAAKATPDVPEMSKPPMTLMLALEPMPSVPTVLSVSALAEPNRTRVSCSASMP